MNHPIANAQMGIVQSKYPGATATPMGGSPWSRCLIRVPGVKIPDGWDRDEVAERSRAADAGAEDREDRNGVE